MAASATSTARDQGFSFGGSLKPSTPVVLSLPRTEQEGLPSASLPSLSLQLPGGDVEDFKKLCNKATCGLHGRDILDESHRRALQLKSANFSWNFRLEDTNILAEIGRHAKPTPGEQVTATLSALNIYGPGAYFKQHKDSPVFAATFGTLVLGLPSQFQGGLLRVWNEKGQLGVEHDWSREGQEEYVHWAFIALGCWHEVQEVIEGHRITMVYSLQSSNAQEIAHDFFERDIGIRDVSYSPGAVRRGRRYSTFEVPFVPATDDKDLLAPHAPAQPQNVSASENENVQGLAQSQSQNRPAKADADYPMPPQFLRRKFKGSCLNLLRKKSSHE